MLAWENIHILQQHIHYLQEKTGISDLFCVGGCVRDLLLGIKTDPKDVDVTCTGDPKELWNATDRSEMSSFMTEKFGTMTFIPKLAQSEEEEDSKEVLQYELTPFRAEGEYSDHRRPDEITWSDSLVEDAKRRDFTINALYYTNIQHPKSTRPVGGRFDDLGDQETLAKQLKQYGRYVAPYQQFCIIQDPDLIAKFWPEGRFAQEAFVGQLEKDFAADLARAADASLDQDWHCIIDPCLGIQDIMTGKLAAVGDADKRISEDALRIVRAVRFVNVLNQELKLHDNTELFFDFEKETRNSLKKNYYLIKGLPKERIKIELDKVFKRGSAFGFLSLCDELNILKILLPSLHATKGVVQPVRYHPFDVFDHTLLTVYHCEQLSDNYLVRWAAALHDVGKVDQFYLYSLGLKKEDLHEVSALNHRNSSAKIAAKDLENLGFGRKEMEEICRYIDHHHKPEEILAAKASNRKKKLRRLYSDAGYDRLMHLFALVRGDRLGQYNPIQSSNLSEIDYLEALLTELKETEGQFTMKELAINGAVLMETFSLEPGPQIGELLNRAFNWVLDDIQAKNNLESLTNYIRQII